jgi:myo-inositol 2-dehydrogenase/D-chiro-inositol 1-dehydrogenase/scyllo-inositol 2-dehydrogenase (NAD+)
MGENDMVELKVDIIGAGRFSHTLAHYIRDLDEMTIGSVHSRSFDAARQFAAKYGAVPYERLEVMLRESDSQAVLIITPHDTHRNIAIAAAEAGRHIFCEKAMARTVEECHDMIEAADRNNVKLMVAHKRRLRPQYAYIKQVLDTQELGQPMVGNVLGFHWPLYHGKPRWWEHLEKVGGLLHKTGVHDIDNLRFFFGEVDSVYAAEGPKKNAETDYADSLSILLHFESGMIVSMEICPYFPLLSYHRAFSYQFACERGGLRYDPARLTVEHQVGEEPRTVRTFDDFGYDIAFPAELRSFTAWVLHDEPPLLTAEDGLRAVEIMQAAYISAAEGKLVRLPLDRFERRPWNLGREKGAAEPL